MLALKIGLEQSRRADVSQHVRNHIENVLVRVSTEQTDVSPNTAIEKDCSHTGDRVSKGGEEYCDDWGAALVGDRQ